MRYQCFRCGAWIGNLDPPHLCADLERRLKRQERLITIIEDALVSAYVEGDTRALATRIYAALRGRWSDE